MISLLELLNEDAIDFNIEVKGNPTVFARYEDRIVGRLRLLPFEDGFQIDSILVMDDFKGFGIGTNLILFGASELKAPIYSDKTHSKEASFLWQSLVNKGKAKKIEGGKYVTL